MLAGAGSANADAPASGDNIAGKVVYLAPGAALRSGPNLTDTVLFRAPDWTRLTGAEPACTSWNCVVVYQNQSVFARRSRLDLSDKGGQAIAPPTQPQGSGGGAGGAREKLVRGDEGDDVRQVQEALRSKGYNVAVDGRYGRGTEEAVRDFQRANGLSPDGRVGPMTRAKLI